MRRRWRNGFGGRCEEIELKRELAEILDGKRGFGNKGFLGGRRRLLRLVARI